MTIDLLKRLLQLIVFVLAQALVFNRIQLFGFAMPLLYVYFIIMLPRNYPRWGLLLWAFALGLIVDVFSNTPGIASASLTLVALLKSYLIELFLPRDADEHIPSSAKALGWGNFATLAALLTFIHCTTFFTIEAFSFFNWLHWLRCIIGSSLLTTLLILTLETARK